MWIYIQNNYLYCCKQFSNSNYISDTYFVRSIIGLLEWLIISINEEEKLKFGYVVVIGISYIIIIVGLLVFLEFIFINKWNLNHNTTFNIEERAQRESKDISSFADNTILINNDNT